MSPEQRAEQIVDAVFLSGSKWGEHDWGFAKTIIATAIREAEDAAREQVVSEIEDELKELPSYGHEEAGLVYRWSDIASLLASHASPLKSQEP